jgi:hypothetical protein
MDSGLEVSPSRPFRQYTSMHTHDLPGSIEKKHLQDLMTELGWAPEACSLASNANPEGYYVRSNARGSEPLLIPLDLLEDATNGDAGRESKLRRMLADRFPKQ